jgi:hypothetical protein
MDLSTTGAMDPMSSRVMMPKSLVKHLLCSLSGDGSIITLLLVWGGQNTLHSWLLYILHYGRDSIQMASAIRMVEICYSLFLMIQRVPIP